MGRERRFEAVNVRNDDFLYVRLGHFAVISVRSLRKTVHNFIQRFGSAFSLLLCGER